MRSILPIAALFGLLALAPLSVHADSAAGVIVVPGNVDCRTTPVNPGADFTLRGTWTVNDDEADFDIFFSNGDSHTNFGNEQGTVPWDATSANICLWSALASSGAVPVPGPAHFVYIDE